MGRKTPKRQGSPCKLGSSPKGIHPPFYAPPSIDAAKNFSINGSFSGSHYLIIGLRCNQICEDFLKGIKLAPEQKTPFEQGFNLSEKFCYIKVKQESKTIRVYRKVRGLFYMKEYSPHKEQSLQELYESVLSNLVAWLVLSFLFCKWFFKLLALEKNRDLPTKISPNI